MITDMLNQHLQKEKASFHMPGHKNGAGMVGTPFEHGVFQYDTTELPGTDALIAPEGAILEAEQFAAACYGAKHSFFLVNGSTGGILTMIYAAFRTGDNVIVDRNCHQAVLNGLILSGAHPIFLTPEESRLEGIPGTLSPESVLKALEIYPDCKGAIITSPNYYGACADIKKIADILHQHHALLLVDEAHGAHFPFSKNFPKSAVSQGADISVTSLHKSLSAPNQCALLHIGHNMSVESIRNCVRMFQTSSPSYILLATMEEALHFAKNFGEEKTEQLLELRRSLAVPSLDDPCKLLPGWYHKGVSGNEAERILREKFGLYAELSDQCRVLLMTSWFNSQKDFQLLQSALAYLDALPARDEPISFSKIEQPSFSRPILSPAEVRNCKTHFVPLTYAKGLICGRAVSAFPPCIPILLPGERITESQINALETLIKEKATITGLSGNQLSVVIE